MGFPIKGRSATASSSSSASSKADRRPNSGAPWARWIAVAGGAGYCPVAPGTVGSLAGVGAFLCVVWGVTAGFGMSGTGGSELAGGGLAVGQPPAGPGPIGLSGIYALGVAALFGLGVWAAGQAEVDFGRHDDGRIVIDEVVGQMIALFPLLWWLERGGNDVFGISFFGVVTGFVLFRLFDIWKPGAIRWAERRFEGGLGVMADDVVAGLHAAAGLSAICALSGGRPWSARAWTTWF